MNPSPDQVALIRSFAAAMPGGWAGNTDAQVRAAMAAATVPNPVATQPTVPKPFTLAQLLGSLSDASQANLDTVPAQAQIIADIKANDVAACGNWIGFLADTAKVTPTEAAALGAIVGATQPDPSWTSAVAWDVGTLGRPVDDFDIETARRS